MDNFDLRKYLAEGRLLKEDIQTLNLTSQQKQEFIERINYLIDDEGKDYAMGEAGNILARVLTQDEIEFIEDIEDFGYDSDEVEDYAQSLVGNAEGRLLKEAELTDDLVQRVAQAVADEFTAEDRELDLKYVITPNSIEADPRGGGFDLDVNAGPNTPGDDWKDSKGFGIANYLGDYAGGSFVIRPEGDGHLVTNAASRNAKVAYITPEGEIEIISAEDSKADLGMTDDVETDYMERRKEMSDYIEENKIK